MFMGIAERKEREKEEARKHIIDVAGQLFIEYGAEKLSMRKIAEEVEYSPAFLYLLFKDKNDLLFHIHEKAMSRFRHILEQVESKGDPVGEFRKRVEMYIKFAREEPNLYELLFTMKSPLKDMDVEWTEGKATFTILQSSVEELLKGGYIRKGDARDVSILIWSTLHGLVNLELSGRFNIFKDRDRDRSTEAAIEEFMNLLFS